jgi:hypothetical protein
MVIGIFKAPFTNMSELAIPMKGLFTRVDLQRFILICAIISLERMLIALI